MLPSRSNKGRSTPAAAAAFGVLLLLHNGAHPALLNFRDVEVRQIIESVAELTGKNFLVDNRVKGKVTLIATSEVPDDQVYDMMLSVLRMYGFRAVTGPGDLTRIVPANIAPRYSPRDQSEGLITKIIRVKHLNASAVLPMVKPLMTPQALVHVHKETNSLIVIEAESNLARVEQILQGFDIKSIGSYEVIDLEYMKAKDMAAVLGRARNKQTKHLVEVVVDPKSERLVLTGEPRFRLPLRALIAELDTPPRTQRGQQGLVRIIHLNYANAEEMEKVLKGLLTRQFLDLARTGDLGTGTPAPAEKKPAPTVIKPGEPQPPAAAPEPAGDDRHYTLQADPATNSLIVSGAQLIVQAIVRVARDLDVPRPQVLIEAIIAEITLNKSAELQTRLSGAKRVRNPEGGRDTVNFPGGGAATNLEGLFAAFDFTGANPAFNIFAGGRFNSGNLSVGLLINALRTDGTTNILSTPSILTLNNEKAVLKVGGERSFSTSSEGIEGTTERRQNFERRPVATVFEVTPQITKGDAVKLKIKQTDKRVDLSDRTIPADRIPTLDREIETNVVVNDRDVVVLGGMTRDERTDTKSEVPLLADIPVLGHLFRGRRGDDDKLNLMVFIRPTIFRSPELAADDSGARYAKLRLQQLERLQKVDSLIKGDATLLPRLEKKRKVQKKRKKKRKVSRRKAGSTT